MYIVIHYNQFRGRHQEVISGIEIGFEIPGIGIGIEISGIGIGIETHCKMELELELKIMEL